MKKINLFTISIVALVTFVSVSYSFATAKPASAVYGVFSETYPGAAWSGSGDERVDIYPWIIEETKEPTCQVVKNHPNDAREGSNYMRFQYLKTGWVGFGYTCVYGVIDMSNYGGGKIKFSARAPLTEKTNEKGEKYKEYDASFVKGAEVGFQTQSRRSANKEPLYLGTLNNLKSCGENEDAWTDFEFDIPEDEDLSDVTILLAFVQRDENVQIDTTIDIDNVRWERKPGTVVVDITGIEFSADLQNGSGSNITWYAGDGNTDVGTARSDGWKVANEHINLKIDKFLDKDNNEYPIGNGKTVTSYPFSISSLNKWKFRIYTSSGTATKDGLLPYGKDGSYREDKTPLPLCWRLSDSDLTNFKIEEIVDEDGNRHLQQQGKKDWYCWLYMQNRGSDRYNNEDYAIIWNNGNGYRGSEGDYYGGPNGFDVAPKLYIGANFTNASGNLEYKSIICIECYNE